jgi:1-deoxy-D-xylulose-5-phosphate synthase
MRFVKPLDEALVRALCARHAALVTIEENATRGGAGSAVGELIRSCGLKISLLHLGIPDRFIAHGSRERSLSDAGLDFSGLTTRIEHCGVRRVRPCPWPVVRRRA